MILVDDAQAADNAPTAMLLHSLRPPIELVIAWQTSRFPHGIRRGWGLVILIGVLFPLCLVAVTIRTLVRVRRRNFGIDDGLIILAVVRLIHSSKLPP